MNSITKSKLTNDVIERLARKSFTQAASVSGISEMGEGMFNSVYSMCIHFSDGRKSDVVLKVSPYSSTKVLTIEKRIMHTEIAMYRMLHEKKIPAPVVLACDFSRDDMDCDYFFMTKLTGKSWNKVMLAKEDSARLKEDLGRYLAQLHKSKGERFWDHKEKSALQFSTWREAFCFQMESLLSDAKQGHIPLPFRQIEKALAPHLHLLDEIKTPSLVYSDLWAGNIFLTDASGRYEIEGFIDPERSFWGDPFVDLTGSHGVFSDIKNEPEIQKGYAEATGKSFAVTHNDEIRMSMYRLHGAMFLGTEIYRYNKLFGFFQLLYSKMLVRKYLKELNSYRR